jgi:hypothetical protein
MHISLFAPGYCNGGTLALILLSPISHLSFVLSQATVRSCAYSCDIDLSLTVELMSPSLIPLISIYMFFTKDILHKLNYCRGC